MERMKRLKKERGEERGGASWARHKRKREGWARLGPSTPPKITHRAPGWPHRAQGQKVRGKVSFVPSIPLVLKDTYAHPYGHINTRLHTCTCIHTDLFLLEGGSDLSLCARPTRKRRSKPRLVSQRQGAAVETKAGPSAPLSCTKTSYG